MTWILRHGEKLKITFDFFQSIFYMFTDIENFYYITLKNMYPRAWSKQKHRSLGFL